jgi:hypothetical protein
VHSNVIFSPHRLKLQIGNLIKVAHGNFSSIGADEHLLLQQINNSIEFKCLTEIEADKAIHREVNFIETSIPIRAMLVYREFVCLRKK